MSYEYESARKLELVDIKDVIIHMLSCQIFSRAHTHTHTQEYTGKVRYRKSIAGSSAKVPCQVVLLLVEEGAECRYSTKIGAERDCVAQLNPQIITAPP